MKHITLKPHWTNSGLAALGAIGLFIRDQSKRVKDPTAPLHYKQYAIAAVVGYAVGSLIGDLDRFGRGEPKAKLSDGGAKKGGKTRQRRLKANGFTERTDGSVYWRGKWAGARRDLMIMTKAGKPTNAPSKTMNAKLISTYERLAND